MYVDMFVNMRRRRRSAKRAIVACKKMAGVLCHGSVSRLRLPSANIYILCVLVMKQDQDRCGRVGMVKRRL